MRPFLLLALVYALCVALPPAVSAGDNLGCAICVILIGLIRQDRFMLAEDDPRWSRKICGVFPPYQRSSCQDLLETLSFDELSTVDLSLAGPEDFCARRGLCTRPQCRLWDVKRDFEPAKILETIGHVESVSKKRQVVKTEKKRGWDFGDVLEHLPALDDDDDKFSPFDTLRGASWRGKDCDDTNVDVHPGRKVNSFGTSVDHNCNGIFGVDENGEDIEEVLCGNSKPKGIVVLGDSISAHFHIPTPNRANLTLDDLVLMAMNEADYPQCSWATGFATDYKLCSEVSNLKLTSVYQKMRERNRCNHRDYQNISRNGARSTSLYRDLVPTVGRETATDHPAIVFYSMLANDVCNGRNGTGSMTSPSEFHEYVTNSLVYLDGILPAGSTVVLVGLIHGELMWDSMFDKPHFIGTTYGALWDFLACLEETACWAWLNGDAGARQSGSDHAESLRVVLRDIARTQEYTNFGVVYLEHPDREYHSDYANGGGNLADLYEVMDGGHPSVTGEILMGDYIWRIMERDFADIIGPVNPNNQRIQELFGDQGGY